MFTICIIPDFARILHETHHSGVSRIYFPFGKQGSVFSVWFSTVRYFSRVLTALPPSVTPISYFSTWVYYLQAHLKQVSPTVPSSVVDFK